MRSDLLTGKKSPHNRPGEKANASQCKPMRLGSFSRTIVLAASCARSLITILVHRFCQIFRERKRQPHVLTGCRRGVFRNGQVRFDVFGRCATGSLAFAIGLADLGWSQNSDQPGSTSEAKSNVEQLDFVIEKSASITSRLSPENFQRVNIGELEGGTKGVLWLTLSNDTESAFNLSRIEASCGCLDVKSFGNAIPVGGSLKVSVNISVPKKGVVKTSRDSIRFIESAESVFFFELEYDLLGVANFSVPEVAPKALVGADECVFRVPLYFSKPVLPTDILIVGTGDLMKIKCEVLVDGDRHFARCKMPLEAKGELMLGGELRLEVPGRKITHEIPCFISRQREIVIMPSIVRFVLKEKNWTGEITIRDNRKAESRKDDLAIAVQGDSGLKISVEKTKVKDLYRVKLSFARETNAMQTIVPGKLNWQVAWDGGISEFSTPSIRVE